MTATCQWCGGQSRLRTLTIVDCSDNKKLSRELQATQRVCDTCLTEEDFFCAKHRRVKLAVYDNKYETDEAPDDLTLSGICVDCVEDNLDDLSKSESARYLEMLYAIDEEMPETLASMRRCGLPTEPSFERRVLFNLLVSAHCDGMTLDQMLEYLYFVAQVVDEAMKSDTEASVLFPV